MPFPQNTSRLSPACHRRTPEAGRSPCISPHRRRDARSPFGPSRSSPNPDSSNTTPLPQEEEEDEASRENEPLQGGGGGGGGGSVTTPPESASRKVARIASFIVSFLSILVCNVSNPLMVGQPHISITVVLIYTSLVYMVAATVIDVALELVCHSLRVPVQQRHLKIHDFHLCAGSFSNIISNLGAFFGGMPSRCPLTLQMGLYMLGNFSTARFKILVLKIKDIPLFGNAHETSFRSKIDPRRWGTFQRNYWLAGLCFLISFLCVLVDQVAVQTTAQGSLNPWVLMFAANVVFSVFNFVQQDIAFMDSEENQQGVGLFVSFKQFSSVLRVITTQQFVFSWIGIIAGVAGAEPSGTFTREMFYDTWAEFLTFGNFWMNVFNVAQLISLFSLSILNFFGASLTGTAFNLATVVALLAGFLPKIGVEAVGYQPNIPLTLASVFFATLGLIPSEFYSRVLRDREKGVKSERQSRVQSAADISIVVDHIDIQNMK